MWKIQTAQIKEIYYSLISRGLFHEEQKGCHKETRGTGELLYIDQYIPMESKMSQKNLANAWIDYRKAYDMAVKKWIIDILKQYKISKEVKKSIEKTLKTAKWNWQQEIKV